MNIEWNHRQCIVCQTSVSLTIEHVIPKSLGGILESRFLCKSCNDRFGHGFEAKARLAPEIRETVFDLGENFRELSENLEKGALYKSAFGEHSTVQKLRKNGDFGPTKLDDASLIVPEREAAESLLWLPPVMQEDFVPMSM